MFKTRLVLAATLVSSTTAFAQDSAQVNVICSVQAEWCNMIQTVFARSTGVKVNMSLQGSGEALAQLIAERAKPKTDAWFGGTGCAPVPARRCAASCCPCSSPRWWLH